MPSIPLDHFPAEFSARCYKCSSSSVHFNFTKHPWMWSKLEIQYSCRMCGVSGYGEDNVIAKFGPQLESWRREQNRTAREIKEIRDAAEREATERAESEKAEADAAAARERRAIAQKEEEYKMMVNEALERRRNLQLENKRRRDREYRERRKLKLAMNAMTEEMRLAEERAAEARRLREARELLAVAAGKCAWRDCNEHRTETSKYCSRKCSNRNAAWNLKMRQK